MARLECGTNSLECAWVNGMTVQQMRQSTRYQGLVGVLDINNDAVVQLYDDVNDSWVVAGNNDVIGADDTLQFVTAGGEKGTL